MNQWRAVTLSSFLVVASGCADMNQKQMGTALGAALGGAAGSQIAGQGNRAVGIAAGAAVGGLIGNRVGKYLSDQDKKRAAAATTKTAETGKPEQFRTASGARVTTAAAPVSSQPTPSTPTAPQQVATAAPTTPECRTVRQTIVHQNGNTESEDVKLCNGPDGWQPA